MAGVCSSPATSSRNISSHPLPLDSYYWEHAPWALHDPFWFFSIGGGLTLFTYALHRLDPVFILGEGAGIFIYSRNLYLIWRKPRRLAGADA